MTAITGFTAERMLQIENETVVGGSLDGDDLVLLRRDGTPINLGSVRGPIGPQMPPGSLTAFAATTPPAGWLLCYGQQISRATYSDLFAVIGTAYGAGDGTTTFNVPDLRGRVPVGLDNMGGSDAGRLSVTNALGGTGGAEKHTLTSSEMPSHTHGDGTLSAASAGSHQHGIGTSEAPTQDHSFPIYNIAPFGTTETLTKAAGAHTHDITGATGSAGSGAAHNNMPPYTLLNYIIKT